MKGTVKSQIFGDPIVSTDRGKAFSTLWHWAHFPWHGKYAVPIFTVEVWARPRIDKEWLVTCVFARPNDRGETGWGVAVGSQGELAAMILGKQSRWVWNQTPIVDGQWHHLVMTYDGKDVRLRVDDAESKQDEILTEPLDLAHPPGLQIGSQGNVICEGLIQRVRLSAGMIPVESGEELLCDWKVDNRGRLVDRAGGGLSAVVKSIPRESLDEAERRDYQAGPAPLDVPARHIALTAGDAAHADGPDALSLDGPWQMVEGNADGCDWSQSIQAIVPGSVHEALRAAGKIPDPTFGLNDAIAREQSFKTWWFRKTFARPAGEGNRLVFDGVAIHCAIWLNGNKLGEHEGMFGGPAFDVQSLLRDENELIVRIDPAPVGPPWFAPTANTGWKKTVVFNNVYGWHYCNIPALGIWRSVRVESAPGMKMGDPFVVTHDVGSGDISVRFDLHGPAGGWRGALVGTIGPENFAGDVSHFRFDIGSHEALHAVHLRMKIADPRPWWPNGLGQQNLYRLKLSFVPEVGQADFRTTTFGLRTISMAPLPEGTRRSLYNWTFVINGRPTFMKGTGWCTMDASMDFSRARYQRFLQLAKEQNCQMLRCWGSGMPETDDFYDLCDRLGIAVMQEWPTAWNSHEEQPFDTLEETVRLNTLRLRNHPSLLMWGGGNESSKPCGKAIDMMGKLAIELDGTRAFHRGEPWGGSEHNYACWWGKAHLDRNLKIAGRFFGEFGIASMPNYESVQRYLPEEEKTLWPPKENGVLAHHTPVFNTMEDMARLQQYAGYFSAGATMRRFIQASQIAQAEAVRHTLERARTRWPDCTGALMYKLNDNYPAASWSTVDWYGAPKISHWFVQDAFAPLHACVLFDSFSCEGKKLSAPVFLLDDAEELGDDAWTARVRAYDGQLRLIQECEFPGEGTVGRVRKVGTFFLSERETQASLLLIVAEVYRGGRLADRTFYFLNFEEKKDSLFELPRTTLSLSVQDGGAVIRNTGHLPAVGAAVVRPNAMDDFSAGENYFWLDAGESRLIRISHVDGLVAHCWNLQGEDINRTPARGRG